MFTATLHRVGLVSYLESLHALSALTLLVGRQEGIRPVKNGGMVEVGTG